uniref:Glutamine amidotransferase-like class 1 domain-containing protein 1 n=1 Tax=Dicentrarchus labrax TaxID=13489 RepID=A0A8P4FWX2_DICLA
THALKTGSYLTDRIISKGAKNNAATHSVVYYFMFHLNEGKPIDFTGVDESTARWVQDFNVKPYATPAKLESIDEPVCAVGQGVSALCCATEGQSWIFSGYSLTGPSVFELVRRPDFANLPLVVEDFVKDSGGSYTEDAVHVVIDRHLITGQNMQSTSLAVNNLILLCGAK